MLQYRAKSLDNNVWQFWRRYLVRHRLNVPVGQYGSLLPRPSAEALLLASAEKPFGCLSKRNLGEKFSVNLSGPTTGAAQRGGGWGLRGGELQKSSTGGENNEKMGHVLKLGLSWGETTK